MSYDLGRRTPLGSLWGRFRRELGWRRSAEGAFSLEGRHAITKTAGLGDAIAGIRYGQSAGGLSV